MEPVQWIKSKYTAKKTKGKFKSAVSGSASTKKHKKSPQTQKPTMQHVMVLGGKNMKTTWIWRKIQ